MPILDLKEMLNQGVPSQTLKEVLKSLIKVSLVGDFVEITERGELRNFLLEGIDR